MIRPSWSAAAIVALLTLVAPIARNGDAAAQNPARTLDIGGPPLDSVPRRCYTDSLLTAALAIFNGPAAAQVFGDQPLKQGVIVDGNLVVYRGALRIDGTVHGNVVVLDGDALVTRTGNVSGDIIVLGGTLDVDAQAHVGGRQLRCGESVPLVRLLNGTVAMRPSGRSIDKLASALSVNVDGLRLTPYLGTGQYNRVEGLPIKIGGDGAYQLSARDSIHASAYGIFRTARDPSHSRPTIGYHLQAEWTHEGALPVTFGIEGGQTVTATLDRPFTPLESGLSALVLRRDYRDWYLRRGGSVFTDLRFSREATVSLSYAVSRQTTLLAVDAFSLLRGTEPWRPNPLIDDGKYRAFTARFTLDARDEVRHPVVQWFWRLEFRRVLSNDLTPVSSLPTTIRDPLPSSGYAASEGSADIRAYLRLSPAQRLNLRLTAGGYIAGDPLTIQDRVAIGGADPLSGYDFRSINCDHRRKPDPATPALCDRQMAMQVEYRHQLPIELSTRVGGYSIGIHKPDFVLFADAGSAWIAGDSAGRVPAGRIQALKEWRSDIGAGITTGSLGAYVARSLVDKLPIQLLFLFNRRF